MSTTVEQHGCLFIVTIKMEFFGGINAEHLAMQVGRWQAGIERVWNGPEGVRQIGCCSLKFKVTVKTTAGGGDPDYHQLLVKAGPGRSKTGGYGPGRTVGGLMHTTDNDYVAAHEAGHLLGLRNEYHDHTLIPSWNDNPQPVGQPQSIMAETWRSRGGVAPAALPSHINNVIQRLKIDCPWWCCPFGWCIGLIGRAASLVGLSLPTAAVALPELPTREPIDWVRLSPEEIIQGVRSGDPMIMEEAVQELMRRADRAFNESLLTSRSSLDRWACALALGETAGEASASALRPLLQDSHPSVRLAAAESLLKLGDQSGIETLKELARVQEPMFGHPPVLVGDYARLLLESSAPKAELG